MNKIRNYETINNIFILTFVKIKPLMKWKDNSLTIVIKIKKT
jgi:hypothetical protein